MKTIELKEITTEMNKEVLVESYNEKGLFHNTKTGNLLFYGGNMTYPFVLGLFSSLSHLFTEKPDNVEEIEEDKTVTEVFALKMLAISLNKEKIKDLK